MLIHHHHRLLAYRHLLYSRGVDRSQPMKQFYASSFLHDFGSSMMSLFVLFYLYQLGWSLPVIVGYVLVGEILKAPLRHLGNRLIVSWGAQKLALIGNVIWILFTLSLLLVGQPGGWSWGLLAAAVIFEAASHSAYWTAWDFNLISFEKPEKGGKQLSLIWIFGDLSRILAPMAGGVVAQIWGFQASLAVAGLLLLLSVGPLVGLKSAASPQDTEKIKKSLKPRSLWEIYRRLPKRKLWSFYLSHVTGLIGSFWALWLAIAIFTTQTYSGLGILFAASSVVSIAISWLVGRLIDKGLGRPVLLTSGLLESLTSGLRLLVTGVPLAVAHNFLQQQSSGYTLTLFQWYFDKKRPEEERLAFFQIYSYFFYFFNSLILAGLIACLVIFSTSQLEVLRLTSVFLGIAVGLLITGLSLSDKTAGRGNQTK